jgi:hypothetical protein
MTEEILTKENKALVRSFYEGGTNSTSKTYGEIFHSSFTVTVPRYLPWGGTSNLDKYLAQVLPQVTAVLDFSRCKIISLVAENNSVVIVVELGLKGTDGNVVISEHWEIKEGKAISLWVAYFEALQLLGLLKQNAVAEKH